VKEVSDDILEQMEFVVGQCKVVLDYIRE